MSIEIITEATDELTEAMARLIPQLSRSAPAPTRDSLAQIVGQDGVYLLVFRDDAAAGAGDTCAAGPEAGDSSEAGAGPILGTLTLATFAIPTGLRAWIEDVVVDEAARGKGAGAALTYAAVELAHKLGARTVDLTSRPSREAANRLYQRCGFVQRQTNVYRAETTPAE